MTEQERSSNPSELEIGMIFDGKELIVENEGRNMATIRHEGDLDGENYRIMMVGYALTPNENHVKVILNSEMEIFPDDGEFYQNFASQLKSRTFGGTLK